MTLERKKKKIDYEKIDPEMRELVRAINRNPGIYTSSGHFGSGSHKHTPWVFITANNIVQYNKFYWMMYIPKSTKWVIESNHGDPSLYDNKLHFWLKGLYDLTQEDCDEFAARINKSLDRKDVISKLPFPLNRLKDNIKASQTFKDIKHWITFKMFDVRIRFHGLIKIDDLEHKRCSCPMGKEKFDDVHRRHTHWKVNLKKDPFEPDQGGCGKCLWECNVNCDFNEIIKKGLTITDERDELISKQQEEIDKLKKTISLYASLDGELFE